MSHSYARTRKACFYAYLSMSSIFCLPPLLFVTFREMYGISYTLLGTLVLINFCTQLAVDLVFSFFSKRFNIHRTVKIMPLLTSLGLTTYALVPTLFPQFAYAGLVAGTIIFSTASGLCEVLLSPTIAALPSEHPDKDMSMLHSLYAWGVLLTVIITTLFLNLFGAQYWMYLTLFLALFPLGASYLFSTSPLPPMDVSHNPATASGTKNRTLGLALCILCIFLGSSAENTMSNWISTYMENALGIPKAYGDIIGLALFAVLLGLVRTAYAKYGRNIHGVLLWSMAGAAACYLIVTFTGNVFIALIACVMTGCFTSMLWPGALILMEEEMPNVGIVAYALMAAGGDFGASIAPQLMGVVVDYVSASGWAAELGATLSLTAEQVGMKTGMLVSSLFPILGAVLLIYTGRYFARHKNP